MLQSVTIETQAANAERLTPLHPVGAVAATIARRLRRRSGKPILYVAETARRAREIAALLRLLAGPEEVAHLPRWDGFPADGVPASAVSVGTRMSVLRWLLDRDKRPGAIVTTAAALMRRVPPRRIWTNAHIEFRIGDALDVDDVRQRLRRIGYVLDERCDEAGEAAIHGRVVEFFPAAAPRPCRIEHEDGIITAIRSYDPVTQRSVASSEHLIVDPATEEIAEGDEARDDRPLTGIYRDAETFFDYLPDGEILLEAQSDRGASAYLASLEDAEDDASADFLAPDEWRAAVTERLAAVVEDTTEDRDEATVPLFAREDDPSAALSDFIAPLRDRGYRVVLAGPAGDLMRRWTRRLNRRLGDAPCAVAGWSEVLEADPGAILKWDTGLAEGFLAHGDKVAVIALRDVAGQGSVPNAAETTGGFKRREEGIRIGDAVVHFDHGVAVLEGVEPLGDQAGSGEALRLRFADDATLLVPLNEIGALWRYGGSGTDVKLDKLKGNGWTPKRDRIVGEITRTAERMVALLRDKDAAKAHPLQPDRVRFERFCARFPHELTVGQQQAIDEILSDLKSGRPMDRLLCGDVGFGKTEVALRAVAATAFADRQAVIVAPTTILARPHYELFRKRFARDGVKVALLSRLQSAAEARGVKDGIADGSVQILVATHAVFGEDVSFRDLGLVAIDEEQRFGSRHKKAVRALAQDVHVLSMTATPIPRTLQAGFVGLHDLSVIATPPVRRRPIRTRVVAFDDDTIRDALTRERERGGQSFLVCPRIEDIEPIAERLAAVVPDLAVTALHGEMSPADVDRGMLAFAAGENDVLLATNIVESGLDVPAANTMIVYRPDRFGLSQLHQLRGRVGRGARRGTTLLATEPDAELTDAARERLATLERLTALGSGFDIAARDLDLRGAGELLGEEQAGHLQMVGLSFYRRMLERALSAAKGEPVADDWRTDLNVGFAGSIPVDHVPEPEVRIELAAALDQVAHEASLAELHADIVDRFGAMPDALETRFRLAALRLRATALGIRKLDAGPKAVAATFSRTEADALRRRLKPKKGDPLRWSELRLILDEESEGEAPRLDAVERLLDRIE